MATVWYKDVPVPTDPVGLKAREYELLANKAAKEGELPTALELFTIANLIDPSNYRILINRGYILKELGCNSQAFYFANQAIKLDPKDANGYGLLGEINLAIRRKEEADKNFQKAIELEPTTKQFIDKAKLNAPPPYKGTELRLPKSTLDETFNEKLMAKSWAINNWWYLPTSLSNPNATLNQQLKFFSTMNQGDAVSKINDKNIVEKLLKFREFGFSKDINIMRGLSIMLHPGIFTDSEGSHFYELVDRFESIPDVILWAPDIPYHLMLSLGSEKIYSHNEDSLLMSSDETPNIKKEKKARKELLERAWKEALRVKEMNPLVFILFPALKQRYFTKKEKFMGKGLTFLTEFVDMCVKLQSTNFMGFLEAAQMLSEIQEAKGLREEAKKTLKLIIGTKVTTKYRIEEEEFYKRIALSHANLALMHQHDKEYNEAWEHYKKSLVLDFKENVMFNTMTLFIVEDWRTPKWRFDNAHAFIKKYNQNFDKRPIKTIKEIDFWPNVFQKAMGQDVQLEYCEIATKQKEIDNITKLFEKMNRSPCYGCKQLVAQAKQCSGCDLAVYCSKECQVKDWPNHKAKCKEVKASKSK